jgi:hypothetical protein
MNFIRKLLKSKKKARVKLGGGGPPVESVASQRASDRKSRPTHFPELTKEAEESINILLSFIDQHLTSKHIYRERGDSRIVEKIVGLVGKSSFEKKLKKILKGGKDVHTAAGAVKSILANAEPLIPYKICRALIDQVEDGAFPSATKLQAFLKSKEKEIPRKELLQRLVQHLHGLVGEAESNHASSGSLASIFSPIVLKASESDDDLNGDVQVRRDVLQCIISNALSLSPVGGPGNIEKGRAQQVVPSPVKYARKGGYILPPPGEKLQDLDLSYAWELTYCFSNDTDGYEQLLDLLTVATGKPGEYEECIRQFTDFRAIQRRRSNDLYALLFEYPVDFSHKDNVAQLQNVFIEGCRSYKSITMTFEAMLGSGTDIGTEFDAYSALPPAKEPGTSPSTPASTRSNRSRPSPQTPEEHREALKDLLEEEERIRRLRWGETDTFSGIGMNPSETVERARKLSSEKTPSNPFEATGPRVISWEPVYSHLKEAREQIVKQLEKSRKKLGDNVPPYRIRDLHRVVAVPCTKELKRDGIDLLNEYNLDKLDSLRPTKKSIIVNSLVYEPFLEFTPRSEAMKNYVSALEDIVFARREEFKQKWGEYPLGKGEEKEAWTPGSNKSSAKGEAEDMEARKHFPNGTFLVDKNELSAYAKQRIKVVEPTIGKEEEDQTIANAFRRVTTEDAQSP